MKYFQLKYFPIYDMLKRQLRYNSKR